MPNDMPRFRIPDQDQLDVGKNFEDNPSTTPPDVTQSQPAILDVVQTETPTPLDLPSDQITESAPPDPIEDVALHTQFPQSFLLPQAVVTQIKVRAICG